MRNFFKAIRSFHEDEEGLESLQVVMIVAISAVILLAIIKLWPRVQEWLGRETDKVLEFES